LHLEGGIDHVANDELHGRCADQLLSAVFDPRKVETMSVVAFDMIGTFFGLDVPRRALGNLGAPDAAMELWLAQSLRDYFAASHADAYVPLGQVLEADLPRALAALGVSPNEDGRRVVMQAMSNLEPVEGAAEACQILRAAGYELVALTNGAARLTRSLLERANLAWLFADMLSADAVGKSKPHRSVYEQVLQRDANGWLVASHSWDTLGAHKAGLRTAWVAGVESRYLDVYPLPDLRANNLVDAAQRIAFHE
jgi:2-haloacid dehalogenase